MVVGDFAQGTQVAIIGGGTGGYPAAIRAAQLGLEVVLVERDYLGGVCLNWGCIPSKAIIHVSDLKTQMEHADKFGLIASDMKVDIGKLIGWKDGIVEKLRKGVTTLLSKHNVEVIHGAAKFTGDRSFSVEGEDGHHRFEFENLILATGSVPAELPGMPFDGELVIDSTDALEPKELPQRMVVVGAGAVGLELGTAYAKLGTQVTVLEAGEEILKGLDPDIRPVMEKALKSHGIELITGARVQGMDKKNGAAVLQYETNDGEQTVEADKVLVAIGRRPVTSGFGFEKLGVELDDHGFIKVNEKMQTSASHVYAVGDVVGNPMLAHKASYQGKIAAEVIAGEAAAFEGVSVPGVIFSDPEIAWVGLTAEEAREQGYETKVGVFPFKALGRALTLGSDTAGFAKVVSDAEAGTVLGVHIVGPSASDLIAEGCLAVASMSHVDDLTLTIHPHPTLPESVEEAAEQVERRAIHIFDPGPREKTK